jgi:hypothetical protein
MTELRKKEFIEMLEKSGLLFEDKEKFIHCDIPTLGKITYYPKANKVQISRTNTWEVDGLKYVRSVLCSTTKVEIKNPLIYENTSLVKIKEIKSNEELRDDFAKNALIGILSNNTYNEFMSGNNGLPVPSEVVRLSYEYADEFIKQRKF